jgi:hypothetical protein
MARFGCYDSNEFEPVSNKNVICRRELLKGGIALAGALRPRDMNLKHWMRLPKRKKLPLTELEMEKKSC